MPACCRRTPILGLARDGGEPASHLALIAEHLRRHVAERELEESVLQRFLARLDYLSMEFGRREDYAALADKAGQAERIVAFFATPASVYGAICAGLAEAGWPSAPAWCWKSRSAMTWNRPVR